MSKFIAIQTEEHEELLNVAKIIQPLLQDVDEDASTEFVEEFVRMRDEERLQEIFFLFAKQHELMYQSRAKDLDSFCSCLIYLLTFMENMEQIEKGLECIVEAFTCEAGIANHKALQLKMLMNTYNSVPIYATTGYLAQMVFTKTLEFARHSDQFKEMIPYLDHLASWVIDWNKEEDSEAKADLYHDVAVNLAELAQKEEKDKEKIETLAFSWLKKYLVCETKISSRALKSIQKLVILGLEHPSVYQVEELLSIPALEKARQADEKTAGILELLGLFVSGNISDLDAYLKTKKSLVDELGVNVETLYTKMRVLNLCSICKGRTEVPLDEVRKVLKVDNVEDIIINAAHYNVLRGRIDELRQVLLVQSALQRKFDIPEWVALDTSLDKWIEKIQALKDMHQKTIDMAGA